MVVVAADIGGADAADVGTDCVENNAVVTIRRRPGVVDGDVEEVDECNLMVLTLDAEGDNVVVVVAADIDDTVVAAAGVNRIGVVVAGTAAVVVSYIDAVERTTVYEENYPHNYPHLRPILPSSFHVLFLLHHQSLPDVVV